ncbi:MAG TPA: branched-chain amino acid ABC transporter permease [Bacillota bacterium]|nr:branched-chain amino acid ABC transporter permease [Bacillota bacterium]
MDNRWKRQRNLLWAAVVAIGVLPLLTRNVNLQHVLILFVMYAGLGEAWNIVTGLAGQTSFGHSAFFGIGAYAAAVAYWKYGASPWIGMAVGSFAAAALAFVISYPVFRLEGKYFSIATLAFGEIMMQLFKSWDYVDGATGIIIPVAPASLVNFQFHGEKLPYFYIAFAMFILALAAFVAVERSRFGMYLKAIKNNQDAAMSLGINPAKYKLLAMVSSAALTALFGSFYAQYILYIDPFMVFSLDLSLKIVLLTVLGGLGSVWGPILGAALLIPLSEYTRIALGGTGKGIDLMVFGLLIMIVTSFQPKGIIGLLGKRQPNLKGGASKDASTAA